MFSEIVNLQLNNMSIFIPHVHKDIKASFIKKTFEELNIAIVDHIDLVEKIDKNGKKFNYAYVHFKYWCSNERAEKLYFSIKSPTEKAKLTYKDHYFWILLENNTKKFEVKPQQDNIPDIFEKYKIAPGVYDLTELGKIVLDKIQKY